MIPAWGSTAGQVPVETQLLLLELGGEGESEGQEGTGEGSAEVAGGGAGRRLYAVLLPLIEDDRFRTSLRPAR